MYPGQNRHRQLIVGVLFPITVDISVRSRAKVLGAWNIIKNYFTGEKVQCSYDKFLVTLTYLLFYFCGNSFS